MTKRILLFFVALLLVGCTSAKKIERTPENMEMIAGEISTALQENDGKKIMSYLSKDCKKEVSQEMILEAWQILKTDAGGMVDITMDVMETEDMGRVMIVYAFEKSAVRLSLEFNEATQVERIHVMQVQPAPEVISTDEFEEVALRVGYHNMLNGILTLPKGIENPPVAILVQGSGATDLNEEIYANRPFEDIAHGLAKKGIATIRYDKRNYAYPEWAGIRSASLMWEYFNDFSAVVHQLEDQPVDNKKIYIIGHSQGGMLAPRLAYDHPEIKGIISLSGTPRGLEEVIKDQQINALLAKGYELDKIQGLLDAIDKSVNEIQALTKETATDKVVWNLPLTYWYQMNQARPSIVFDELKCDVLILQAEEDFQVFFESDYEAWKQLVKGKENVMLKSYPGLSHLFTPSINGTVEDYAIPAKMDQSVIDDMVSWIKFRKIMEVKK